MAVYLKVNGEWVRFPDWPNLQTYLKISDNIQYFATTRYWFKKRRCDKCPYCVAYETNRGNWLIVWCLMEGCEI